ncbi:transmembrane protein C1orf162 homolog [Gymnogyps californianus]|uniref:transmembrane protein C1orf162 homolog n=1 Tax=Gymnogyps californianus TaxID=33616 RepID=UPI0021C63DAB|nr:transmembrane protein C1orf162 homolog [Gymnogyps californianus]
MGGSSSKTNAVTPEPISTTVTVDTTVYSSTAHFKASEVICWCINSHEILYLLLAFLSGVLLAILVFAIICLFRKKCKRSHQNPQEQVPSQTVTEESAKNIQNEVAYTTLVFQPSRTPMAV